MRTTFSDYQPGHVQRVDLRVMVGHSDATPTRPAHSMLRIHGTDIETVTAIVVLFVDGFDDLDMVGIEPCSPVHGCAHSYWRGPSRLTTEHVLTALTALAGLTGSPTLPYAKPISE